jgi:hypothetical protein
MYLSKKRLVKKIVLTCMLIGILFGKSYAQSNASHLRISVLTCAPGQELYSTFGHTAIRIIDSSRQTDLVYNYGTFDFSDPDFYSKFTRGKLDYFLSVAPLDDFMYEYRSENRDVHEQILAADDGTKEIIRLALAENLAGPARYYKYDFLYNNCTSRVRDILLKYAGLKADQELVPAGTSFRDMLHEYLNKGNQAWSKLGIDLVLGSPIDRKVNITESMFLPDYLMKGIDSSVHHPSSHVLQEKIRINQGNGQPTPFRNTPLILFSLLAIVAGIIASLKHKTAITLTRLIDFFLLLFTGLTGCLLLFMWFGTDHAACAANYNLLWAMPCNLVAAFAVWKRPGWLQKYFTFYTLVLLATLLGWLWLPQELNTALLPVCLWLLFRTNRLRKK